MKVATPFVFAQILCIILLVAKLGHVIDWSWWAVTAPVWGSWILSILGIPLLAIALAVKEKSK
jgi:hypothetical protein